MLKVSQFWRFRRIRPFRWKNHLGHTLDFIHITSEYGYRQDPVTFVKGTFHNGIDLRCAKGSLVYAMMPGVIEKVANSESGYGHHVIFEQFLVINFKKSQNFFDFYNLLYAIPFFFVILRQKTW